MRLLLAVGVLFVCALAGGVVWARHAEEPSYPHVSTAPLPAGPRPAPPPGMRWFGIDHVVVAVPKGITQVADLLCRDDSISWVAVDVPSRITGTVNCPAMSLPGQDTEQIVVDDSGTPKPLRCDVQCAGTFERHGLYVTFTSMRTSARADYAALEASTTVLPQNWTTKDGDLVPA